MRLVFIKDTIIKINVILEFGALIMRKEPSPRSLLVYPALLSIWLSISCAALFYTDIKTAMAGVLILAAVAAATLGAFSLALAFGINIITIIVYSAMIYVVYDLNPSSMLLIVTFVTAEIGTAILAWNTNKQFLSVNRMMERDKLLIDEMRINDDKTGLMRFHYALRVISNEIARGIRYGTPFSILMMKMNEWDHLAETMGLESREGLMKEICETLQTSSRNVDTLFINMDKIGIILPETNREGAIVIAQRLEEQINRKTKLTPRTGIVCFPIDSIGEDDLVRKCDSALKFAEETGTTRVVYQDIVKSEGSSINQFFTKSLDVYESKNKKNEAEEKDTAAGVEETDVHFCGIHNLKDIENLQKILKKVPEIEIIRLIDFSESEIIFRIGMEHTKLSDKLIHFLDIPNITIEDRKNVIVIRLDPSIEIKS